MNDTTRLLKLVNANDTCIPYLGDIKRGLDLLNSRFHRVGFLVTKTLVLNQLKELFGCNTLKHIKIAIYDRDVCSFSDDEES